MQLTVQKEGMPLKGAWQEWEVGLHKHTFNNAECKVMHQGHGKPWYVYRLGGELEKDMQVLVVLNLK